jgi:hypothetical protein
MAFVEFTRPDDTPVSVNTDHVEKFAPVPTSGPTMGPLTEGTRIYFDTGRHQDVKELQDEVHRRLAS